MASHPPSIWQMVVSVLAAFFGVQSEHNRQRDFTKGSFWGYVFIGIAAAFGFVVMVILMVRWALSIAGV